jgi:hypothetical protein
VRNLERVCEARARRWVHDCGQRVLARACRLRDPDLLGHPLNIHKRDPYGFVRDLLIDESESGEVVDTSDGTRADKDR